MRSTVDLDLVRGLRVRLDAGLRRLLRPGEPVALVDFPNHANAGDSLIWLGELAWLRAAGHELVYTADHTGLCPRELERRLPGGTILLHGGGNLGDLWPTYQALRERVITSFPRHRIVQLPQTVHFREAAAVARMERVVRSHPDLVVCVRDRRSEAFARERLAARTELLPDMAFALGPLHPCPAAHEAVCLLRGDSERAEHVVVPAGPQLDWPARTRRWRSLRQTTRVVGKLSALLPPLARTAAPLLSRGYELLARERLRAALRVIGLGEVLVTDRLHGHILALLAGVPHVLLDNSYGKLGEFRAAWTAAAVTARQASAKENPNLLARELHPNRRPRILSAAAP
jgi:exopolysaccharide biosynthesis predicted pyruvyltransferase EpsI